MSNTHDQIHYNNTSKPGGHIQKSSISDGSRHVSNTFAFESI